MSYQDTFKRVEIKYLLSASQKRELMKTIKKHMILDQYGRTTIQNIYYDTPDWQLIRTSLEKPIYKEKLRLRSYGTADPGKTVFIEIKKKYDGVVYKRRTSATEAEAMAYLNHGIKIAGHVDQISREIDYFKSFYKGLKPAMVISYEREAFYGMEDPDFRVTFDENILWREEDLTLRKDAYGNAILNPGQCLMEVKAAAAMPMWLTGEMNRLGIFQTSFSKYGRAYEMKLMNEYTKAERRA
ncbi:MAG: polyphosphate polymerase domain-containing protein [Lachnospiraceae bacterium]|nr:polyphosphate polymerase domain-containing protein [Lachnospiraceae bacterium]